MVSFSTFLTFRFTGYLFTVSRTLPTWSDSQTLQEGRLANTKMSANSRGFDFPQLRRCRTFPSTHESNRDCPVRNRGSPIPSPRACRLLHRVVPALPHDVPHPNRN